MTIRNVQLAQWPVYFVLIFLTFCTVSTKAAGVFWLALLIMGFFYWQKKIRNPFESKSNFNLIPFALKITASTWLFFCFFALFLKTIPMIYWSGPWEERHGEFRLLIGATAFLLLYKYQHLPKNWGKAVGYALTVACILAFALVSIRGINSAPTNQLPWAAGISLLSCLLLTWSFSVPASQKILAFWRLGSLLALCAVLISGVRGSYLLAIVWPILWLRLTAHSSLIRPSDLLKKVLLALIFSIAVISLAPHTISPVTRILQVLSELGLMADSNSTWSNSSNIARLMLWRDGLESFRNHWFIGSGFEGAKDVIKQTAINNQLSAIGLLGHFHNDYIHTAVEYGIFGLLSLLCYSLGMSWCAWLLYRAGHSTQASGVLALIVMHVSTGLSNVNFAHNYYPTVLSFTVSLLLLSPHLSHVDSSPNQGVDRQI
jgi:O-antigen ligase